MRVVRVSIVISMLLVMLAVQTVTATHWTSRTVVDKSVAQQCVGGTKIEAPQSGVPYIVFFDGDHDNSFTSRNPVIRHGRREPRLSSLLVAAGRLRRFSTRERTVRLDFGLTAPFPQQRKSVQLRILRSTQRRTISRPGRDPQVNSRGAIGCPMRSR